MSSPFTSGHIPDPRFTFDFVALDPDDELDSSTSRWSTWLSVEPLSRGPEPRPDWVVTSQAAIDTELGLLKTGKEADAFLLERAVPDSDRVGEACLMVAKRYRNDEHRTFHRSAAYTEGRRIRNTRDMRALQGRSTYGRSVAAGQWARAEWEALVRCWQLGLPVPYPVQVDGTEILMEWIHSDGETAPRLAQTRPGPALLASYFEQMRAVLLRLTEAGLVHGDLSPYNVLAAGERLVVIDLPQLIDLVANPSGTEFLLRDCTNMCRWFTARGLEVDEQALFGELLAAVF
ncbi:RIO1 family regulatory kinase/ATPase [Nocardioides sp.]|uniref:serine protein kinase RIO n=1 Tax=Nocardioides sp. TaxID=35761 RepID=UPI00262E9CDC|nr:RIO1 family regulatory kinase/ATPase [Nocardioides sp.]